MWLLSLPLHEVMATMENTVQKNSNIFKKSLKQLWGGVQYTITRMLCNTVSNTSLPECCANIVNNTSSSLTHALPISSFETILHTT